MNKYPICIISKDRADTCTTHNLLEPYGIKYFYMVEPQDYDSYVERFGKDKVVNIRANDKGVYYVRNFCIEWSKQEGYEKHWQIDDNVKKIFYRLMNKYKGTRDRVLITDPTKMINTIEEMADKCVNYGGGCIGHDGFAFSKKKNIDVNKMIYCFQLLNNNVKSRYQPNTSEDVDFSVRLLMEKYVTMVFNDYSFTKPKSGSTKGGCNSADYKNNGRKKMNVNLCKTYPNWFTEYTKNGQSEIKPSKIWRTFSQKPMMKK